MKTRIISALVGTVILLAVLFCPLTWVFVLAVAAATAIAVYELLHNTGTVNNNVLLFGSMVLAVAAVLLCADSTERSAWWLMALFAVYGAFVMTVWWLCRRTVPAASAAKALVFTLYATMGFAALAAIRVYPIFGLEYVLLALVIPWMNDTGAYFVGTFLGKHKMAPVISPKKSWEGFFGGWMISIGLTAVYGVICNALQPALSSLRLDIGLFAILAAVLAPLSVAGDLLASVVKRRCGIKDYGNIMPGHGGVMDRFDSVIIIAPVLYIALSIWG